MSNRGKMMVEMCRELVSEEEEMSMSSSYSETFSDDDSDVNLFSDNSSADEDYEPPSSSSDSDEDDSETGLLIHQHSLEGINQEEEEKWNDINISQPDFPDYPVNDLEILVSEDNIKSIIDSYKLMINDEVYELIVKETNRYAEQKLANQNLPRKCRLQKWKPTTKEEIQNFFSIILTMGLTAVPHINLYWSKDKKFHNEFITSLMPRDRFLLLLNCFHVSNNEEQRQPNDRLFKVRPLLSLLLNNFKAVIKPGKDLVVDESMIPFRGRLVFRQYLPNKSHKYGMKLYKICTTDGYTCEIIVYTGKGTTAGSNSRSEEIVLNLFQAIEYAEGRTVYADNYYSSIPLAEKLYKLKTTYCGTLRSNRKGIDEELLKKKLKKGEVCGKEKNKIKIIKWQDKRQVLMLTTIPSHNETLVNSGKKTKSGEPLKKPGCVIDYNKAKKGVDISDQMSSYHSVLRKGIKWYRKLGFELLFGVSVVNAWIIYNKISGHRKISITNFRSNLAEALSNNANSSRSERSVNKRRSHTFIKPEGPGRKQRKMCKGCYKSLRETMTSREADKKVRRVITYCGDCEGQPGFCLPCFNEFHSS